MALTIGLVAGAASAAGTLYGIGKVGQYLWPKKSESLVRLLVAKGKKNSVKTTPTSSLFSEGMQEHQYRTISGEQEIEEISDVEREVNHYLTVSASSLGLSVAGALFYPPLGLLSLPGLLYVYAPWVQDLYHSIVKEKRLRYVVVDTIFVAGALATGNFVVAAIIATFVTFSKKLLMKAEDRSQEKFLNIFNERPNSLWILKDDIEVEIPIEQLAMGDLIVVHAGETIAVDGVIVSGYASIDQRALTGESQPAEKGPGDQVFALTIVLSGQMVMTATNAGQETVAAQIGTIFNQTADYRRSIQWQWLEFVDKTTLPTLATGAVALPFLGPVGTLGVLLAMGFPYCMRVVAPITLLNFLNVASQNSILMKDGRSFELLAQVDTVVFDKTGTLTEEQPTVGEVYVLHDELNDLFDHTLDQTPEDTLLMYAAAAEHKQSHPIAKAIRQEASERGLACPEIEEAKYEIGYGVRVNVGQKSVWVGSVRFMELEGFTIPTQIESIQSDCYEQGYSLVCVAIDERVVGGIELQPTIRPEAARLVRYLKEQNISLYILSGDHEKPTRKLANSLGIEHYFAETLPENKAEVIKTLQSEGKFVCFIGDGINDSIALKTANVSISLRGASTIATDTAQIVLMDESLQQLDRVFELAQNYNKTMDTGIAVMLIPNIIGVGGILFFHFGLLSATALYYTGMALGLGNTTLSTLNEQRKNRHDE